MPYICALPLLSSCPQTPMKGLPLSSPLVFSPGVRGCQARHAGCDRPRARVGSRGAGRGACMGAMQPAMQSWSGPEQTYRPAWASRVLRARMCAVHHPPPPPPQSMQSTSFTFCLPLPHRQGARWRRRRGGTLRAWRRGCRRWGAVPCLAWHSMASHADAMPCRAVPCRAMPCRAWHSTPRQVACRCSRHPQHRCLQCLGLVWIFRVWLSAAGNSLIDCSSCPPARANISNVQAARRRPPRPATRFRMLPPGTLVHI